MKNLKMTMNMRGVMFGLMAGCLALTTGCFSTNSDSREDAEVAGVLQGDADAAGKFSAEVEGAVVTVHEVNADGTLGPAVGEAETDAEGAFVVKTNLKGARTLIVRAVREGREWKARLKDEFREGSSHRCRPLNLESSLEADVWLELQKTAPGRSVYSHEATASIDADIALSVEGEYRGSDSAARAQLIARLAQATRAASQARAGALTTVAVRAEAAAQKARQAEAEFRMRLHEAKRDTAKIREAREAFLRAVAQAHVEAEVKATAYARASEAAYRSAARAADSLAASVRAAVARNGARTLAVASDVALQARFRVAGATEAQVDSVARAGKSFLVAVDAAASREACDSALARYRDHADASFDSAFTALATALQSVAAALDSLSAALGLQVGAQAGDSETGEAYMNAQLEAAAQIQAVLGLLNDEAKAEAVADVVAFLNVRLHDDD